MAGESDMDVTADWYWEGKAIARFLAKDVGEDLTVSASKTLIDALQESFTGALRHRMAPVALLWTDEIKSQKF